MKLQKHLSVAMIGLLASTEVYAQKKNFTYNFYGQVRTDLFYNSRANQETADGLFYMFPLDRLKDEKGKDLNAIPNGSFYTLYSRLGIDVQGPKIRNIQTNGKIEVDFRGSGNQLATIRLRHAYFTLSSRGSSILLGQTWHPLFGDVFPQILNLATGAPFQPFSRAPQIRYRFQHNNILLTGAAIWQSQYLSVGPGNVKSQQYIKHSCVPEFYLGMDYRSNRWIVGAGIQFMSLVPRTEAQIEENGNIHRYKVNERINSFSYEGHFKYIASKWLIAGKTVLGKNLTQVSMLGGYGSIVDNSGRINKEYSPLAMSSSWINIVYGTKWKPVFFAGYIKNLGSNEQLNEIYGVGTNIDQLSTAGAELTYNLKHWKFGVEYTWTAAWYGQTQSNGKVSNTHMIHNHRMVGSALFIF